ncbi:MAG: RpiB/LacA/LacB family sugar-phosphate isomerase [Gemmataceae bacterium]|nr:RpiB/LacA/LacB family sugar-phosphate isomerase [Gemmataceae bacterium]
MNGSSDQRSATLCWPGKVLSEDDLRRHLSSQREILLAPTTIVTPLAIDFLRARKIAVRRDVVKTVEAEPVQAGTWGWADEASSGIVAAAVQALIREGVHLTALSKITDPIAWSRETANAIEAERIAGAVAFCGDPELVVCVANKMSGIRAAAVTGVRQATRVRQKLGANLLAVEMPGRTVFEVRQILKQAVGGQCPEPLARVLQELDGHAHR